MPKKIRLNTGCSVYWGERNSLSPKGSPIFLEIYRSSVKNIYFFAVGSRETLDFAWQKFKSKNILTKLIEIVQLPPLMFGWAAIINEFSKYNKKICPFKLIKKCPFLFHDHVFFSETQPIFKLTVKTNSEIDSIITIVKNMYFTKLEELMKSRKQTLNI